MTNVKIKIAYVCFNILLRFFNPDFVIKNIYFLQSNIIYIFV